MTYKTHCSTAALCGLAYALHANSIGAPEMAGVVGLAVVGGLLPDIDEPSSFLGRRLYPLHLLFRLAVSNPFTWAVLALFVHGAAGLRRRIGRARALARRMAGHRGLTHSLVGFGIASLLAAEVLPSLYAGSLMLGYLSHLVLDATTPAGIPLSLPLSDSRVSLSIRRRRAGP